MQFLNVLAQPVGKSYCQSHEIEGTCRNGHGIVLVSPHAQSLAGSSPELLCRVGMGAGGKAWPGSERGGV